MKRPWFPFYVGDYTRDTARLTTEAHGAYLLLILDYWVNGAPPDDDETLATITKLPVAIWRKRKASIRPFFKVEGGKWTHSRIDREIEAANEKHQKRVEAGGKGGKAKANGKQNPSNARSNATSSEQALLYQPESQSQPLSEPELKKGESNSPSKNFEVIEGKPKPIDEGYDPSDRAIEYAYSLGMKKADLNSELSKFVAMSMATRAVSFNPDASFKVWCDRWLDHKRKREPGFVPEQITAEGQAVTKFFVEQGTMEWTCHLAEARRTGRPAPPCLDTRIGDVIKTGWWFTKPIPDNYDPCTGEYSGPKSDEAAA